MLDAEEELIRNVPLVAVLVYTITEWALGRKKMCAYLNETFLYLTYQGKHNEL